MSARRGSRVNTGAGRGLPAGSAHRTTVPSEYVCTTSNTIRSAWGSGPMETASRAGPAGAPLARAQITEAVTVSIVVPWMPEIGSVSFRVVIRGAQPVTDIGYASPTGAAAGSRSSIRSVRAPGRSSGTTISSRTGSPCRACEGVLVTSAASAVPGQPSAAATTARTAAAEIRSRRLSLPIIATLARPSSSSGRTDTGLTR
nr:hypothetical protein [Micromonospora sp. ATCC 39149]